MYQAQMGAQVRYMPGTGGVHAGWDWDVKELCACAIPCPSITQVTCRVVLVEGEWETDQQRLTKKCCVMGQFICRQETIVAGTPLFTATVERNSTSERIVLH
jgi:hypothetical protein